MRPRLVLAAALAISPTLLIGQEVSLTDWRTCAGVKDSLARLICFDNLAVGVSSAEWRACVEVEAYRARLTCFDNLVIEVPSARWRACASTEAYRERLTCFDNLALEVTSDESRDCAGVEDSLERLICFDDLTMRMGEPEEPEDARSEGEPDQPRAAGSWQLEEEVDRGRRSIFDPISDRTTWIATLSADREQSSVRETALLALRCKNGELEIMTGFDEFLDLNTLITIAFDEDVAQDQAWYPSQDRKFFFFREAQILGFLQKLQSSKRLTIRVTVYGAGPRTAVFPLDAEETKGVLDSIREHCPTIGHGTRAARW